MVQSGETATQHTIEDIQKWPPSHHHKQQKVRQMEESTILLNVSQLPVTMIKYTNNYPNKGKCLVCLFQRVQSMALGPLVLGLWWQIIQWMEHVVEETCSSFHYCGQKESYRKAWDVSICVNSMSPVT